MKVIEIKQQVYQQNDRIASELRAEMKQRGTLLINLMSSPGAGKTTTLVRTLEALRGEMRIGIIEADIDSDVDALTVARAGAQAVQLHTGGMCHLDAFMTREGLKALNPAGLDLIFLENIGNLLCPAEVDTGAARNVMILSVPEGDDKPLKYPQIFRVVDLVLVNKIDALPFFDFDLTVFRQRVSALNPSAQILPYSARTGEGLGAWTDWIRAAAAQWKRA